MSARTFKTTSLSNAPLYTAADVAHYLRIPPSTVRAWAFGQSYRVGKETKRFKPVIQIADPKGRHLSFINLVELFVLSAIRRQHGVALKQVRSALVYLAKKFPSEHPLADHQFHTDRVDLFVEKFGEYLNISREGQIAIKEVIVARLQCVMRDDKGNPLKLYVQPRGEALADRGIVVIDPRLSFGRPVIDGTGIRTEIIKDRWIAGESLASIAEDYGRQPSEIEEIIRAEFPLAA
jgi:uncharacterized protein (DUF433 family)